MSGLIARLQNVKAGTWIAALAFLVVLMVYLGGRDVEPRPPADLPGYEAPVAEGLHLSEFRPLQTPADGYVTSQECRDCHPRQHATWSASYHRTMTQLVSPETVIADFERAAFTDIAHQRSYDLWWEGPQLRVRMDSPDAPEVELAEQIERPLLMSTGSHHMQIFWYPTGNSRVLGQLPIVYLREAGRWMPRNSAFITPPGEETFFSEAGRWNFECIDCHTTHGRTRPRPDGSLDTRVAEFGIACEACHGPGERHVAARRRQEQGFAQDGPDLPDDIVNPAQLTHQGSSQVCGRCHSLSMPLSREDGERLHEHGFRYRPGDDLQETRFIIRMDQASIDHIREFTQRFNTDDLMSQYLDDSFWSDGEVRVAGRDFNAISDSACYQLGEMSCISCHELHQPADDSRSPSAWADDQLRADLSGDGACLQCHDHEQYQSRRHTRHAAGSSGSRCWNCHMPHTTYGLLKAIRSHTISSPDVAVNLQTGRPNACNLCHLDRTLAWTAEHLSEWYGIEQPKFDDDQRGVSGAVLSMMTGDACQRALWAWSCGWAPAQEASGTAWMPPFLAVLLEDPYDAVRYIAGRSLMSLPDYQDLRYDFISAPEVRAETAERVLTTWTDGSRSPSDSRLLIDRERRLQRDALDRLRSLRDDHPVMISE